MRTEIRRPGPPFTAPPTPAPAPHLTPAVAPPRSIAEQIRTNLPNALIISGLINLTGSALIRGLYGVPFDIGVTATFQLVGTMIGAGYGPVKAALGSMLGAGLASVGSERRHAGQA